MSQHDQVIDDQEGSTFLAELNQALAAIFSNNSGGTEPAVTVAYQWWADTAAGMLKQRNAANNGWVSVALLSNFALPSVQGQLATRFTTTGSSTAYLLTPAPAISANTAGLRFRVAFHTAAGATPTLAVSGQTALPLKYKDSVGVKQAITSAQVPANWVGDVETDGTDWVLVDIADQGFSPLPPMSIAADTTLSWSHVGHTVLATAGGITITLPSGGNYSFALSFSSSASGVLTLAFPGSTDYKTTMIPGDTVMLVCDGGTGYRAYFALSSVDGSHAVGNWVEGGMTSVVAHSAIGGTHYGGKIRVSRRGTVRVWLSGVSSAYTGTYLYLYKNGSVVWSAGPYGYGGTAEVNTHIDVPVEVGDYLRPRIHNGLYADAGYVQIQVGVATPGRMSVERTIGG
ncbi:MAG: hypothetical protein HZC22_10355 [Rhodocyclales bacterium]|nr:hypothetical protein [Rhodocyclales bacterium]